MLLFIFMAHDMIILTVHRCNFSSLGFANKHWVTSNNKAATNTGLRKVLCSDAHNIPKTSFNVHHKETAGGSRNLFYSTSSSFFFKGVD